MQKLIFILIVSALAIWIGNKAKNTPIAMNDVVLENIEALVNGENGLPVICTSSGNYICPNFGENVGEIYIGYSLRP